MNEKFIDLDALSILTDAELNLFGEVDIDHALAQRAWKDIDMKWFKTNGDRRFTIRAVMQGEVDVRQKEVLDFTPTHVLIQKIGPNVRAKIYLVLDGDNRWFGRADWWLGKTDEGLYQLWEHLMEGEEQFIDVDVIFASGAIRSRTLLGGE